MSSLTRFSTLPTELRLEIWRHALREVQRIVVLDAQLKVAIATDPRNPSHQERIVFGGTFWGPWPPGTKNAILPSLAQQTVETLSITCHESREMVLKEFPNTIRVTSPPGKFMSEDEKEEETPVQVMSGTKEKCMNIRCNFERDVFLIKETKSDWVYFRDNSTFASRAIRCLQSDISSQRADEFRQVLGKIKHILIERPSPAWANCQTRHLGSFIGPKSDEYKNLLAGTSSLERLFLYPTETDFKAGDGNFSWRLMHEDGKKEEEAKSDDNKEAADAIDQLYKVIGYRFVNDACYNTSMVHLEDVARNSETTTCEQLMGDVGSEAPGLWDNLGFDEAFPSKDEVVNMKPKQIFIA